MKKYFGIVLVVLSILLITLAVQTGYSKSTLEETDVGIVYSIAHQNQPQSPIIAEGIIFQVYSISFNFVKSKDVAYSNLSTSAIMVNSPRESYQIARGVSVPCKYLISDAITFDDFQSYECNIYYTISRTDYKPNALAGYPKQIDKYPFSGDLGLRWAPSIIT